MDSLRAFPPFPDGNAGATVTAVAGASFAAIRNGRALVQHIQAAAARWDNLVKVRSDSSVHGVKSQLLHQPEASAKTVDVRR